MRSIQNLLFAILFVCGIGCTPKQNLNTAPKLTDHVNVFIGTDGPGNTYPGAVVPFGMVQLSPDNGLPGWDRIGGYFYPDSTIAGFSHMHLTGTGAGDLYDLLFMPTNSRFQEDLWPEKKAFRAYSKFSHEQEEAEPGYYKVMLQNFGITAELTASKRVGFHRYTFPEDRKSEISLDLAYKLNWDNPTKTFVEVEDSVTISGYRLSEGWAKDQRVYFVAQFSKPFSRLSQRNDSTYFATEFSTKANEQVLVKVAVSSVSVEGARKNLVAEIPHWDFNKTRSEAQQAWEAQLSKINITGTDYQKEVFYSNLYHTMLTPSTHSDVDGKFKAANGTVKQAEGYTRYHTFSLWDTYRATHPLYTILTPKKVEDFVASFIAHYNETGLLPVWELAGNETDMMIGYHSVPVIVDAYFKGIPMNAEKAYDACVATAKSDAWSLSDYKKLGFVPADDSKEGHWSMSKTIEYAYDDWCIAQFSKALGKTEDYEYFIKRAQNWKNHWDEGSTFLRPRNTNGEFVKEFSPKAYTELICESNAWQYAWHVQQDVPELIRIMGKERFEAKLDSMFSFYPTPNDKLPIFSTGMIGQYAHGNEPVHHVAYLYNWLNKPERTQQLVRQIIESQYTNKPDGFCGNEDCGQMSAWLVFNSLGMYPVNPADGIYHLSVPWVEKAVMNLPNGKTLTINAQGLSDTNYIVKSVHLNGKELNRKYITHAEILAGGTLDFSLKN